MPFDPRGKSNRQLNEERVKIVADARAFLEANESNWGKEQEEQYGKMLSDASDITAAIKRREQVSKLEEEKTQIRGDIEKPERKGETPPIQTVSIRSGIDGNGRPIYHEVPVSVRGSDEYRKAFNQALMGSRAAEGKLRDLAAEQFAALQSDDMEQAGYLLMPEQMAAGILKDVDDLVFIRRYAKIHTVTEAGSLGIRKRTARANTFNWSSELTVSTADTALKYGKKVLTPEHLTGQIEVSRDLLRRSAGTAESEVRYELARNAAEKMEDGYLTGSGTQQPLGVFTASSDGISTSRDVQTGSTTSITADGLLDAKYKLKAQYRNGSLGAVRWFFHRDAIKIISKLKDAENRYYWQQGLIAGQPDTLLNYPVDESERAPNTFTTGQYVGLLANWNYYEIADSLDMEIQVLVELLARTNQIAYIGRMKTDGMPTVEEAFVRLITN